MRQPSVAGSFYPFSPTQLRSEAKGYVEAASPKVARKERLAIVCPHAGYVYSGATAAYSFASASNFSRPDITAIIIGPNHTGMGTPLSVSFEDWQTPLGALSCDAELADEIVRGCPIARRDELAHLQEHSCEVQLPFLKLCAPSARIVCICMGYQELGPARQLGKAMFEAVKKLKRDAIVVASSDFTHYESAEAAGRKDGEAIKLLEGMDEDGFEKLVEGRGLSICGHGPIAAALAYSKLAGAKKCELLRYTNSGETTGDDSEVVAYAALAISR